MYKEEIKAKRLFIVGVAIIVITCAGLIAAVVNIKSKNQVIKNLQTSCASKDSVINRQNGAIAAGIATIKADSLVFVRHDKIGREIAAKCQLLFISKNN